MKTKLIYLTDSYLTYHKSSITEIGKSGQQDYVILDQTIFYSQGGGQPADKGIIKSDTGKIVVKTVLYNKGNIKHVGNISGELIINQKVTGNINWENRYRNMQVHTAGHLLDDAISTILPDAKATRGMHGIGNKNYIEYAGILQLNKEDIINLEKKVNQLRKSSLSVVTEFVTLAQLKKKSDWIPPNLPKSKKLRIIQIGKGKVIPDGGTQTKNTNEIPPIQIAIIEHKNKNTKIHYLLNFPPKSKKQTKPETSDTDINKEINNIQKSFEKDLESALHTGNFQELHNKYLSKKHGLTNKLLKKLPNLSPSDKLKLGPLLNNLKKSQKLAINQAEKKHLKSAIEASNLDLTVPAKPQQTGNLHPTTRTIRQMNEFFRYYGFSIAIGPEIESAEFNFRKLNLPEGHPATDLQDTLFIKEPDIMLRTHTSSVETRILSNQKPPIRVVVPGKVYRNETSNKTNSSFFHHYQGFVVDKGITMQHLKGTLELFHKFLFGNDIVLRFRYKYYPEVSPGMGVDIQCRFCSGVGCEVCKWCGYIEVLGSGMIHYNTLLMCGIDPEVYTGFAFGMGLDRLVMSKYGITDIRKLYGENLNYQ